MDFFTEVDIKREQLTPILGEDIEHDYQYKYDIDGNFYYGEYDTIPLSDLILKMKEELSRRCELHIIYKEGVKVELKGRVSLESTAKNEALAVLAVYGVAKVD